MKTIGELKKTMEALPNETKIRFCSAMHRLHEHLDDCNECAGYIATGDGDLCPNGKRIVSEAMQPASFVE